ncbi:hypothetical protein FHX15_002692 [Rhizobium sp. BK650]|nr:hypothetical protein [Rhizobium sp. BK650]
MGPKSPIPAMASNDTYESVGMDRFISIVDDVGRSGRLGRDAFGARLYSLTFPEPANGFDHPVTILSRFSAQPCLAPSQRLARASPISLSPSERPDRATVREQTTRANYLKTQAMLPHESSML